MYFRTPEVGRSRSSQGLQKCEAKKECHAWRGEAWSQTAVPAPALRAESQLVASQGPTRFGKCEDRRKRITNDCFSMPKLEGEN